MAKTTTKLLIAAAFVATAGCAKKRPEVLPPAPAATPTPQATMPTGEQPATSDTVSPGSAADFQRSVVSDTVHFDTDQYDIDSAAQQILNDQAKWLMRYPSVHVTIEGHTDDRGTREYNLALGDRRANAAANYLIAQGVPASRITTISYGKERPVALGDTPDAWAQNRRAVTVVVQ